MHTRRHVAAALFIAISFASHAGAQTRATGAGTQGLMLGAHINATVIHSPEDAAIPLGGKLGEEQVNGAGGGGMVGWGFNKWFMLYTGGDAALVTMRNVGYCMRSCPDPIPGAKAEKRNGKFVFAHADIGARFSLPRTNSAWVPFLNAALTVRRASSDEFIGGKVVLEGVGLTAGGGVQYFLNRKIAIEVNTQFTTGEMDRLKVDGEKVDMDRWEPSYKQTRALRINAGARFYPSLPGR